MAQFVGRVWRPTTTWIWRSGVSGGFATQHPGERIGIVSRDSAAREVAEDTGAKAAGGAAIGAVAGGVLGGLAGLLVGIGALAIPGVGPVVAGGILASAFGLGGRTAVAGAGIGAARVAC